MPSSTAKIRPQLSQTAIRTNVSGVICALGLPLTVIGIILTAVGYTVTEGKQHIWYFEIVGPILLGLAVIAFILGYLLRVTAEVGHCCRCSFCCRSTPTLNMLRLDDLDEMTLFQRIDLIEKPTVAYQEPTQTDFHYMPLLASEQ